MPNNAALAVVADSTALAIITATGLKREQIELIKSTVAVGATDMELALLIQTAHHRGLDLLTRQMHFVKRKVNRQNPITGAYEDVMVGTMQTGIDGFRLIADRTGKYDGQDDAEFEYLDPAKKTYPFLARVRVYKTGVGRPFVGTAHFSEYAQTKYNGELTMMWKNKPHVMLAKCFSSDTEILTDRGFQRFAEVTGRVLQVSERGLEVISAKPFAQSYDGPMVTLDSDDLNFCVTPNHDMVTTAGKIEAGVMYEAARVRPQFEIPRSVRGSRPLADVADARLVLLGAYLADGSWNNGHPRIEVSRPHKVERLRALGLHSKESVRQTAGDVAVARGGRTVVTKSDKTTFHYAQDLFEPYVYGVAKAIDMAAMLGLAREQIRTIVDAWIAFDGSMNKKTGVRRWYSSSPEHVSSFEVMAVAAGYAVNVARTRISDISQRPNYVVTISSRDAIGVRRWGREYNYARSEPNRHHPGLVLTTNGSSQVWCVTVPSGVIVVRRNGFSMLCGNCAEALALRKAFPENLSGLYTDDEMPTIDGEAIVHTTPAARPTGTVTQMPQREQQPAAAATDHAPIIVDVPPEGSDTATLRAWVGKKLAFSSKNWTGKEMAHACAEVAAVLGRDPATVTPKTLSQDLVAYRDAIAAARTAPVQEPAAETAMADAAPEADTPAEPLGRALDDVATLAGSEAYSAIEAYLREHGIDEENATLQELVAHASEADGTGVVYAWRRLKSAGLKVLLELLLKPMLKPEKDEVPS
jgi:hypothetical protein